jgi:hypothetical protein
VEQSDVELETKYLLFFSLAYLLVLNLSKSFFLVEVWEFSQSYKLRTNASFSCTLLNQKLIVIVFFLPTMVSYCLLLSFEVKASKKTNYPLFSWWAHVHVSLNFFLTCPWKKEEKYSSFQVYWKWYNKCKNLHKMMHGTIFPP